jgi:succinate dehydrogenase/fumarate reductase flavoprotein subunit
METHVADVWVIGSGAAGLKAAIAARQAGLSVGVIGKNPPGKGTATQLSGGVFTGAWKGVTEQEHRQNTLNAGRGLNRPDMVEAFVSEVPVRFQEMLDWGFAAESIRGNMVAKGRSPVWGEAIVQCLVAKAQEEGVTFFNHLVVRSLRLEDGCARMVAYSPKRGAWIGLTGRSVVLAAGGAGGLYRRNDNPQRITGDAYVLAYEAGAVLQDMEFVQFYPLALAEPTLPPFIAPPNVADLGTLTNTKGEDILAKYGITERPAAQLARDRLSQCMYRETFLEGQEIRLDLTRVSREDWCTDPFATATWDHLGGRCGAWERPLLMAPVAHFVMGGVCVDPWGVSSVPGLFAAGEATGGLHGANRMGGNALSETIVFGTRAGTTAAAWAAGQETPATDENALAELIPQPAPGQPRASALNLMRELKGIMWTHGGILRRRESLEQGLERVRAIGTEADKTGVAINDPERMQRFVELQMAVKASALILEAAMRRQESRGSHFREDFPEVDDANWHGHLMVWRENNRRVWDFQEIAEKN